MITNKNNVNKYILLSEAAKLCRYTQEYLSLRARQGKLKSIKRGRNWMTTMEWLQDYLDYCDLLPKNNRHYKEPDTDVGRQKSSREITDLARGPNQRENAGETGEPEQNPEANLRIAEDTRQNMEKKPEIDQNFWVLLFNGAKGKILGARDSMGDLLKFIKVSLGEDKLQIKYSTMAFGLAVTLGVFGVLALVASKDAKLFIGYKADKFLAKNSDLSDRGLVVLVRIGAKAGTELGSFVASKIEYLAGPVLGPRQFFADLRQNGVDFLLEANETLPRQAAELGLRTEDAVKNAKNAPDKMWLAIRKKTSDAADGLAMSGRLFAEQFDNQKRSVIGAAGRFKKVAINSGREFFTNVSEISGSAAERAVGLGSSIVQETSSFFRSFGDAFGRVGIKLARLIWGELESNFHVAQNIEPAKLPEDQKEDDQKELSVARQPAQSSAREVIRETERITEITRITEMAQTADYRKDLNDLELRLSKQISIVSLALSNSLSGAIRNEHTYIWAPAERIDSLGQVTINGLQWPGNRGSNGQVLMTNGSGSMYWGTVTSGGGTSGGWTDSGASVALTDATDYVGIGTSSPYAKLSVVGPVVAEYLHATSTTATSTIAGNFYLGGLLNLGDSSYLRASATSTLAAGIDIATGCFAINGQCVGIGTGTVGSGNAGWIPYYAADGTTLTATSNIFIASNGFVGIGTTSPYAKLSVAGQAVAEYFTATSSSATSTFPYLAATQSNLGTIVGGTWQGNIISVAFGGTGSSTLTTGGVLYGDGTSALKATTVGPSNYILYSNNGTPAWTSTTTLGVEGILTFNAPLSRTANAVGLNYLAPLAVNGSNQLYIPQASGSVDGYLAQSDWNSFNNKISSSSLSATLPITYNSATGVFAISYAAPLSLDGSNNLYIADGALAEAKLDINSAPVNNSLLYYNPTAAKLDYISTSTLNLATSSFAIGDISQWVNDSGYITDGNTNWNNDYGFITGINQLGMIGDVSTTTLGYGSILRYNDATQEWESTATSTLGLVTSVDMSVPTGLTISGNPITTAGTLALALDTGYIIPTSTLIYNLDNFWNTPSTRITAGNFIDWTGNQLDVTDSWYNAISDISLTKGYMIVGDDANLAQATSSIFVSSTGQVGIGTTTPRSILNISGTQPQLSLSDTSAGLNAKHWWLKSSNGDFSIGTTSDDLSTNRTYITIASSTGRVGIGTANPTQALEIDGNVKASVYYVSSSYFTSNALTLINGGVSNIANTSTASGATLKLTGGYNANSYLTLQSSGGVGTSDYINFLVGNNGATEAMRIITSGLIGIGTTTPSMLLTVGSSTPSQLAQADRYNSAFISNLLEVSGTGTSTFAGGLRIGTAGLPGALQSLGNATSTFSMGINLDDGCFAIDGTCVGGGSGSGTVGAATEIGQIPYYASASNTLTATSSIFINTNQYVGIGTTTPRSLLQIAGNKPQLTLTDYTAGTDQKHWFLSSQGGNLYIGTSSDALNATTTYLTINKAGYVGIGTVAPQYLLDIKEGGTMTLTSASARTFNLNRRTTSASGSQDTALRVLEEVNPSSSAANKLFVGINSSIGAYGTQPTNQIVGIYGDAHQFGTGDTTLIGVAGYTRNAAATNLSGAFALYAASPANTGGGSINRAGGLYIEPVSVGIENYSIYADGFANSYFGGSVGIGTTTPRSLLQVAGTKPQITLSDMSAGTDAKHWFVQSNNGDFVIGTTTDALNATSTYLTIASSTGNIYIPGKLGIGTTDSSYRLFVRGRTAEDAGLKVMSDDSYTTSFELASGNSYWRMTTDKNDLNGALQLYSGDGGKYVLVAQSTGNVGIGTTSPWMLLTVGSSTPSQLAAADRYNSAFISNLLEVNGTGTSTFAGGLRLGTASQPGALQSLGNATSTFSMGINLDDGCFAIDGVCVGGGSGVTGGADNRLAIFSGATSLTYSDNLTWLRDSSRLGIGTTTPNWQLQIASTSDAYLALSDMSVTNNSAHWWLRNNSGDFQIGTTSLDLGSSNTLLTIASSTGNVGIGTESPGSYKLNVKGAIYASSAVRFDVSSGSANPSTVMYLVNPNSTTLTGGGVSLSFSGGAGASDIAYIRALYEQNSSAYGALTFQTSNNSVKTEKLRITSTGLVGIGTTTPRSLLQVAGTKPQITLSDMSAGTDAKHWFVQSTNGDFVIGTTTDALSATSTYLTIASSTGNVGIGAVSPQEKLTISARSTDKFVANRVNQDVYASKTYTYDGSYNENSETFPVTTDDYFYVGYSEPFSGVYFDIATPPTTTFGSEVDSIDWQYYNGSSWSSLLPDDGTNGFINDGQVTFNIPTNWGSTQLAPDSQARYWIRAFTSNVSHYITNPILETLPNSAIILKNNAFEIYSNSLANYPVMFIDKAGTINISTSSLPHNVNAKLYINSQSVSPSAAGTGYIKAGIYQDLNMFGHEGSESRYAIYNDINIRGRYSVVYGMYNNFQTDIDQEYYLTGLKNYVMSTSTYGNFNMIGVDNNLSGRDGYIYGVSNIIRGLDSAKSLYGSGIITELSSTPLDVLYGIEIYDSSYYNSTGGTQYGLYVDLDDPDVTNYSVYIKNGSGISYFGSNVGIGTTTPNWQLQIASTSDAYLALSDMSVTNNSAHWWLRNNSGDFQVGTTSLDLASSNTILTIASTTGNVGIGTANPTQKLAVIGNALVQSASAGTSAYITVSAGGSNSMYISGTTGGGVINTGYQQPLSIQTNATNAIGINGITQNVTIYKNLGIGTTSPAWNLQVASSSKTRFALSDMSAGTDLKHWLFSSMGGNLYVGTSSDSYATSSLSALTIDSNGKVGIGTTSPSATLAVNGSLYVSGGLYANNGIGTNGYVLQSNGTGFNWVSTTTLGITGSGVTGGADNRLAIFSGATSLEYSDNLAWDRTNSRLGIGTTTPNWQLQIASTSDAYLALSDMSVTNNSAHWWLRNNSGDFQIGTTSLDLGSSNTLLTIASTTGNVGIGTAAPGGYKLNVNGALAASSLYATGQSSATTFRAGNGSLSSMSYGFGSDSTTGFYLPAVNNLGLTVGGSEIMRLVSTGLVGIGTTTPSMLLTVGSSTPSQLALADRYNSAFISNLLEVNGTGTSTFAGGLRIGTAGQPGALQSLGNATSSFAMGINLDDGCFAIDGVCVGGGVGGNVVDTLADTLGAGNDANALNIINTGRIGIGTSTPNWDLQIASTSRAFLALSDMSAGTDAKHWFLSSQGGNLYIGTSSDALTATTTYLTINGAKGNVGIGNTNPGYPLDVTGWTRSSSGFIAGGISMRASNLDIANSNGSESIAWTTSGAGANIIFVTQSTERLRLTNSGRLGLGTSTPNWKLQIASTSDAYLALSDMSVTNNSAHWWLRNNSGDFQIGTTSLDLGSSNTLLTIASSTGNVGIGTESPGSYKLNVNGSIYLNSGAIYAVSTVRSASSLVVQGQIGSVASAVVVGNNTSAIYTSGDGGVMKVNATFAPASGAGNWSVAELAGTVNQRALANGITRGLYVNPALTQAYDYRALETAAYTFNISTTTVLSNTYGALFNQYYLSSTSAVTITNASNLNITGAPIASSSNVTIASSTALTIQGGNVSYLSGVVSNAYSLYVNAPTGALNNYSAVFVDGNVGIGTTTPGYKLHVVSTTGANVAINSAAGNQANLLYRQAGVSKYQTYISSDGLSYSIYDTADRLTIKGGLVGIGTTSPSDLLHIRSSDPKFRIEDSDTNAYSQFSASGSSGTLIISADQGNGADGSNILFNIDGSEKVRFQANGNVGIGTTSPSAKLEVDGSATVTDGIFLLNDAANNGGTKLRLTRGGTQKGEFSSDGGVFSFIAQNGIDMKFNTAADTSAGTSRLYIKNDGNVGIGTSTPNWKLQVASSTGGATLALSDLSAITDQKHWIFSSMGGNLYVSTSSDALATSTLSAFTINSNGLVGIASTSPSATLSVNGSLYVTGGFYANNGIGTNGYVLQSNGIGFNWVSTTTLGISGGATLAIGSAVTSGTAGSVLFVDASGNLGQDNSNFFWDDTTNRLGIGTTSPVSELTISGTTPKLTLTDTSAGANLKHWYLQSTGGTFSIGTTSDAWTNPNSAVFNINNLGYVGIGTTTPQARLHIGTASTTMISDLTDALYVSGELEVGESAYLGPMYFPDDSGSITWIDMGITGNVATSTIERYTAKIGGTGILTVYAEAAGYLGGVTATTTRIGLGTTTPLAMFDIYGASRNVDIGLTASSTTGITYPWTLGVDVADSGKFKISTSTALGSSNDRLVIDTSGRVGIGSSSPLTTLTVQGLTGSNDVLNIASSTGTSLLYVSAAGNVGIGTVSPTYKLDVVGSIFSSLNITIGNSLYFDDTTTGIQGSGGSDFLDLYTNNVSRIYVNSSGLVGIGTTTPNMLLTVGSSTPTRMAAANRYNSAYISGILEVGGNGTSTFEGGIDIYTGCFAINGTCVGGGAGNGTVNSGLAGQLAYYASDGTAVNGTSSIFVTPTGLIGIGTTSPASALSIAGATPKLTLTDTSAGLNAKHWWLKSSNGDFSIGTTSDDLSTNRTYITIASSTGNVGIGTANPGNYKLNVNGTIMTSYSGNTLATLGGSSSGVLTLSTTGNQLKINFSSAGTSFINNGFNFGLGTTSPTMLLTVGSSTPSQLATSDRYNSAFISNLLEVNGTGTSTFAGGLRIGTAGLPGTLQSLGNATSTFSMGINLDDGCFAIDGTCVGGGSGNVVDTLAATLGAGSDANALGITNLGRVGIGTTTPNWQLQIATSTSGATLAITDYSAAEDAKHWWLKSSNGDFSIGTTSDSLASNTTYLTIASSTGNVGIGTANPLGKTHINYDLKNAYGLYIQDTSTPSSRNSESYGVYTDIGYPNATTTGYFVTGITQGSGRQTFYGFRSDLYTICSNANACDSYGVYAKNTGVGLGATVYGLYSLISASSGKTGYALYADAGTGAGTEYSGIFMNGNVGIGDATPSALLTVGNGDLFQINSSGYALGPAGAVGTPTFSFTGDSNTGLYGPGNDTLRFTTGGMDRMSFTATGLVGIGTTTPAWQLQVATTSGGSWFALSDMSATANLKHWTLSSQGGSLYFATSSDALATSTLSALTINQNGFVGIGTTSPYRTLSVNGSLYVSGGFYANNGIGTNGYVLQSNGIGFNWVSTTTLGISGGATLAIGSAVTSGTAGSVLFVDASGNLGQDNSNFFWDDTTNRLGIGTTSPVSELTISGTTPKLTLTDTSAGANLKHWYLQSTGGSFRIGTTSDDLTNPNSAILTISSSGFVGIGTTTPQAALHIGTASTTMLSTFAKSAFIEGELEVLGSAYLGPMEFSSDSGIISWIDMPVSTSVATSTIESYTARLGGTDVLTVYGEANGYLGGISQAIGGRVGIGTSTPWGTLAVYGSSTAPVLTVSASSTASSQGPLASFYSGATETIRIASDGKLGLGTSSLSALLTVGSSTPDDILAEEAYRSLYVAGQIEVGGTGTSTIDNNLYVKGTLRSTASYVGDLIFANMFRFTELSASTTSPLYLRNAAGDDILTFYQDGNIGLGTTTTAYKLNVGGEIGAMGFINISTAEAKKDITFLNNEDEDKILRKIASTSVATYSYKSYMTDETYMGLIAEEAPREVLSVDGKGVDIYKMASFTWAGLKAQQRKIDTLAADIEAIKLKLNMNGSIGDAPPLGGGGGDFFGNFAGILDSFSQIGSIFEDGLARFAKLFAKEAEVGTLRISDQSQATSEQGENASSTYQTIGSAEIATTTTEIFIETSAVELGSKIFVTPLTLADQPLAVVEQVACPADPLKLNFNGSTQGFRVAVKYPAVETIRFNWWIVQAGPKQECPVPSAIDANLDTNDNFESSNPPLEEFNDQSSETPVLGEQPADEEVVEEPIVVEPSVQQAEEQPVVEEPAEPEAQEEMPVEMPVVEEPAEEAPAAEL